MKGVVDVILEGCGGITEAKRHHKRFEEAKACNKGCFPLVAFGNAEFVESSDNVELHVDFGIAESV